MRSHGGEAKRRGQVHPNPWKDARETGVIC